MKKNWKEFFKEFRKEATSKMIAYGILITATSIVLSFVEEED